MDFSTGEWNVFCTDREASLHFYRDLLGFSVTGEEGGAIHLRLGPTRLLLLPFAAAPAGTQPYGSQATFSFDLLTTDLAGAYTYLRQNGVTFERPWQAGAASFIIRDPDNLIIEIIAKAAS